MKKSAQDAECARGLSSQTVLRELHAHPCNRFILKHFRPRRTPIHTRTEHFRSRKVLSKGFQEGLRSHLPERDFGGVCKMSSGTGWPTRDVTSHVSPTYRQIARFAERGSRLSWRSESETKPRSDFCCPGSRRRLFLSRFCLTRPGDLPVRVRF